MAYGGCLGGLQLGMLAALGRAAGRLLFEVEDGLVKMTRNVGESVRSSQRKM